MEKPGKTVVVTCCDCGKPFRIRLWVFEAIKAMEGDDAEFWCYGCSDPPQDIIPAAHDTPIYGADDDMQTGY